MTLESKYGVPVAARVDVRTAQRLREEAMERNVSLAKRLADLIETASMNEAQIEQLEYSHSLAKKRYKEAQERLAQLKTSVVTWMFENGSSREEMEAAIDQINQTYQHGRKP